MYNGRLELQYSEKKQRKLFLRMLNKRWLNSIILGDLKNKPKCHTNEKSASSFSADTHGKQKYENPTNAYSPINKRLVRSSIEQGCIE